MFEVLILGLDKILITVFLELELDDVIRWKPNLVSNLRLENR